jgi:hypothetical protein
LKLSLFSIKFAAGGSYMRRRRGELGEGQLGCIVGLIVFLAVIYVCYKVVPVKVKASELRGTIFDESKSAGSHNDARIRKAILAKANDLELPVTESDVKVSRRNEIIKINVKYTVPIQFPGYVYQWHFEHDAENPIF